MVVSHEPLYFCGVGCHFFFTSHITDLDPLPFFSWSIQLKTQQFYLFKETAFSLTDLSYFYLVSISFSSVVFMILFLPLTLGFVCCSFYSSFRCKVGFPGSSDSKASACNAGDLGLSPGSGRSPGEGNGNPLQYSCLENSMDGGVW